MLILGCGNRACGDDGAGPRTAERLRDLGLDAVECRGESCELLDAWGRADDVIVIDCVTTGAAVGTVHFWDGPPPIRLAKPASTHALGVSEAIELGRLLERLPSRLRVYGIEGRNFARGNGLSPEVQKGVEEVVRRIAANPGGPADAPRPYPRS